MLISIHELQTVLPIEVFSLETVGIEKIIVANHLSNVVCYPNPAQDYFIVSGAEGCNLLIVDIAGRRIFNQKNITGEERINTSAWGKGIYFVIMQLGYDRVVEKIIKE